MYKRQGLASTAASVAFLKQTTVSTFPIVQQTIAVMTQTKLKSMAVAAVLLLFAGSAAVMVSNVLSLNTATAAAPPTAPQAAPRSALVNTQATVVVFRDAPSWNRSADFEDSLSSEGVEFEVRSSTDMATVDLGRYRTVIIPGAQWSTDYYKKFTAQFSRFEKFVTDGGTLVLELNGAERFGIPLPRGVTMANHGATENAILVADHPITAPLQGKLIKAHYASHGYLANLPKDALVLVAESNEGKPDLTRPTFAEYPHGKGRVLAACQCFHDRDGSGRGPLMDTTLDYAGARKWYAKK